jgi:hypothetical protein
MKADSLRPLYTTSAEHYKWIKSALGIHRYLLRKGKLAVMHFFKKEKTSE